MFYIGTKKACEAYNEKVNEAKAYTVSITSNQSANRTDIESNINKHFKIYEE